MFDTPLATTLRLLARARGMNTAELATAIPRAGVATVSAWMRGDKLPGRDQLDALAKAFGVPAGALLAELASSLDPARSQGEHDLLRAWRALAKPQQGALLEVARAMAGQVASRPAVSKPVASKPVGARTAAKKRASKPSLGKPSTSRLSSNKPAR